MNYGVTYRAPPNCRLAGLMCGWCFHHGIPALYPTYAEAAALLTRFPWLKDLEGRVVSERVLMPYVIANVEVFSGYRRIDVIDGRPRAVLHDESKKSYAQLLPLLTRLSKSISFQRLIGSTSRAIVGSRVKRLRINRTLPA